MPSEPYSLARRIRSQLQLPSVNHGSPFWSGLYSTFMQGCLATKSSQKRRSDALSKGRWSVLSPSATLLSAFLIVEDSEVVQGEFFHQLWSVQTASGRPNKNYGSGRHKWKGVGRASS